MKIAQVAPLYESCPPTLYGGTERVVAYLTEELVRKGHDVTLFASGDSQTAARLVAPVNRALRLDPHVSDPLAHHFIMFNQVAKRARDFDIVHFHTDCLHFPMARRLGHPSVTTLHGRLDLPALPALYREFNQMPLISISDSQRLPLTWANWADTVLHGIPGSLYSTGSGAGGYLAFIGRISPEKRPDRAIQIAHRSGLPLKIAAKVDKVDQEYFDAVVRPLLNTKDVEFIGEISDAEKLAFLGDAAALLFPIDWPEPFGLAMIEAMANGTPVIGFRCGSVPEVIDEGLTGLIVDSVDEAVAVVPRVLALDRSAVRDRFEERFEVERMASEYLAVYRRLLTTNQPARVGKEQQPVHGALSIA